MLLVPRWAGKVGQWQSVHAWHVWGKNRAADAIAQLASGRSISWRSLSMNCAMLHRVNIYNRATKQNCIFRLWWEADPSSIFLCFQFCMRSSGVQSCVSHNVTSWGKPAREIPENVSYGLAFGTIRQSIGARPQQRPEVIRETSGSFRECHRTSQRVTGRAAQIGQLLLRRRDST